MIMAENIMESTTRNLSISKKHFELPGKEDDMKCKMIIAIAVCALLVAFPGIAYSAERATDEEAIAMVEMAGKLIEEQGDLALPVISNPEGRFCNKDKTLYVFVYNDKFELVAHPYRPDLIGVRFPEDSRIRIIANITLTEGCCWHKYADRESSEDDIQVTRTYGKVFTSDSKNYYADRESCEDELRVTRTHGKLFTFDSKTYIVCTSVRD
jgi:histidinol phosphatase-like PHP family hydrolase